MKKLIILMLSISTQMQSTSVISTPQQQTPMNMLTKLSIFQNVHKKALVESVKKIKVSSNDINYLQAQFPVEFRFFKDISARTRKYGFRDAWLTMCIRPYMHSLSVENLNRIIEEHYDIFAYLIQVASFNVQKT